MAERERTMYTIAGKFADKKAGSLQVGTIHASTLVQSLQRGGHPTTLARAISEVGRVAKTLYLLNYIDDEHYRRRILIQLNRGEGRHGVARHVFHGQRGELRQRYRQGQEDQLGALGLVVNMIVLWIMWNRTVKDRWQRLSIRLIPLFVGRESLSGSEEASFMSTVPTALLGLEVLG
jgi:TnpA family transposase